MAGEERRQTAKPAGSVHNRPDAPGTLATMRSMPESLAAEAAVLGSMLIDPECIGDVVEIVERDGFAIIIRQLGQGGVQAFQVFWVGFRPSRDKFGVERQRRSAMTVKIGTGAAGDLQQPGAGFSRFPQSIDFCKCFNKHVLHRIFCIRDAGRMSQTHS